MSLEACPRFCYLHTCFVCINLMSLLNLVYDYFSPPNSLPSAASNSPLSPLSPASSPPPSASQSPPQLSSPSFSRRLHAACLSPTSSLQLSDTYPDISLALMRRELDHTKHDLSRAHVDTVRLEERVKMLERTLKETRDMLKAREGELERIRKELKERDKEKEKERRRSDASLLQNVNGSTPTRFPGGSLDTRLAASDLAQRLRARNSPSPSLRVPTPKERELPTDTEEERARIRVQEIYMSRVDSWSGAQVLQAVHDLNSEILQFAASAIESCSFTNTPNQQPNPRLSQSLNDTSSRLGPTMTRLLHARNHSSDPLLIQLALQSSLTLCTARALSSFIIGLPSKSDLLLSQIYSEMQRGEEQPVFKKWRALTERYVSVFYPTLGEYSIGEVADTMVRWCADVLVASGCSFISRSSLPTSNSTSNNTSSTTSPQPSPSSSPPTTFSPPKSLLHNHHHHNNNNNTHQVSPQAHLRTHHHDQLKRIAQRILRIASITREEILSTSFEVVIADPAQAQSQQQQVLAFENNDFASEMVDAFGEYTSESKGRVLGTVELGLRCVTKVGERESAVVGVGNHNNTNGVGAGKDGGEPKFETRLLLRPKVVLESVLEVLDH